MKPVLTLTGRLGAQWGGSLVNTLARIKVIVYTEISEFCVVWSDVERTHISHQKWTLGQELAQQELMTFLHLQKYTRNEAGHTALALCHQENGSFPGCWSTPCGNYLYLDLWFQSVGVHDDGVKVWWQKQEHQNYFKILSYTCQNGWDQ